MEEKEPHADPHPDVPAADPGWPWHWDYNEEEGRDPRGQESYETTGGGGDVASI